ncbi:MAG: 8-oxo-dGTP diphosphatase [Lachnospiraceae bacterium]|nr:8-oxo-dGTP diphosphatase [Lachnospiraceae bacterium]
MKRTTLCYLDDGSRYLMLYRNKKENDENAGKWIGIGGKVEEGETPDQAMIREVSEETGLTVRSFHYYGIVQFVSDIYEAQDMYLYSSRDFSGSLLPECDEGELRWVEKSKLMSLPMWEGDRFFLEKLLSGVDRVSLRLSYEGDRLVSAEDLLKIT